MGYVIRAVIALVCVWAFHAAAPAVVSGIGLPVSGNLWTVLNVGVVVAAVFYIMGRWKA